jgi:hypothetical protein
MFVSVFCFVVFVVVVVVVVLSDSGVVGAAPCARA